MISGGRLGVGVSTLAVNLAVASSQQGARVLLVDADLQPHHAAPLVTLPESGSVADVLASRRDIHEILQLGPGGIQVACGASSPDMESLCTGPAQERLIGQLRTLGRHVDLVVLDAGNGPSEAVARFWESADEILVVMTAELVTVVDAYATIKTSLPPHWISPLQVVVNQVDNLAVAAEAHRRIRESCRRFLKREASLLGCVPRDGRLRTSAEAGVPLVVHSPRSPAAVEFERIAAQLASSDARSMPRTASSAA